jgi:hypothetical protein
VSGEDVRHSYHTEAEVRRLVESRVVDGDRIIENDPDTDEPANVIGRVRMVEAIEYEQ